MGPEMETPPKRPGGRSGRGGSEREEGWQPDLSLGLCLSPQRRLCWMNLAEHPPPLQPGELRGQRGHRGAQIPVLLSHPGQSPGGPKGQIFRTAAGQAAAAPQGECFSPKMGSIPRAPAAPPRREALDLQVEICAAPFAARAAAWVLTPGLSGFWEAAQTRGCQVLTGMRWSRGQDTG